MYKKVLAAINEHLNSELAARYAMNLARATGSKLYLVFAASKGVSSGALGRAEEALARLFKEAAELGVEAEAITELGAPVKKISEIVRREGIDIAFAATRREDVKRRFYKGTVSRGLMLGLPCSVAVVRVVAGRQRPKEILVPLKAKVDYLRERAYFTAKIAEAFESTVHVYHVQKTISKFFHGEIHLTPIELEKRVPVEISRFVSELKGYGVDYSESTSAGGAGRSITVEAFSKRRELIVMGASRRGLISNILRGNPVEEVLRDTPCDLIILRPRHENP